MAPDSNPGRRRRGRRPARGEPDIAPVNADLVVDRSARQVRRSLPHAVASGLRTVNATAPTTFRWAVGWEVLSAVLTGAQLYVIKNLVTALIDLSRDNGHNIGHVLPSFAELTIVTALHGVAAAVLERQQRLLGELVGRAALDRVVDVASQISLARFEEAAFHDRLERATRAATTRPLDVVNGLLSLMLGLLTSVGIVVVLATLEPLLLPLVVVGGVPLLLATLYNSRQSYGFEYAMTTNARERLFLFELFVDRDPAKELRVFNAAGFLRRRYDALSDERISKLRSYLSARQRVALIGTIATSLGGALAVGVLIGLIAGGRIGIATAAASAVAMQALASRLQTVTTGVGKLVESSMFLHDLEDFLGAEVQAQPAPEVRRHGRGLEFVDLAVRHLSFTYPGTQRRVLSDVTLDINKGEVVALVGENGSGKTTLVKLLCKLYDQQEGQILWNGRDISDLDTIEYQARLTVLFQDFVRYHLSVADNIVLGRPDVRVDEAAVKDASGRVGLDRLVAELPSGYGTRLGREFSGGHEISGGQWQRLALARAFYRDGDFLVLDEPTAALDPRAEYELFEQIRELAADRTVLLISHRFANVRMADRIYVLDEGRVAEAGDHDSLMAAGGLYAELYGMQQESSIRRRA